MKIWTSREILSEIKPCVSLFLHMRLLFILNLIFQFFFCLVISFTFFFLCFIEFEFFFYFLLTFLRNLSLTFRTFVNSNLFDPFKFSFLSFFLSFFSFLFFSFFVACSFFLFFFSFYLRPQLCICTRKDLHLRGFDK